MKPHTQGHGGHKSGSGTGAGADADAEAFNRCLNTEPSCGFRVNDLLRTTLPISSPRICKHTQTHINIHTYVYCALDAPLTHTPTHIHFEFMYKMLK